MPASNPPLPASCETEIDLSTEMGRIRVFVANSSMMAAATRSAAGSPFFLLVTVVSNLPRAMPRP